MTTRRPRIGIVTSVIDGRSARGTAGVARELLARLLPSDEFDITLIHHEPSDDPIYAKYPTLRIPHLPGPFDRTVLRELVFWLSLQKPFDIVHYLTPRVWPSYLATKARRIIVTPHDAGVMLPLYTKGLADFLFMFTNRFLHSRMDCIIAVSRYAKEEIARSYCINPERITVIPNALPSHFLQPTSNRRPASHLPARYLLSVGRFDPHKNILRLVEAYALARKRGVLLPLVLIGGRHTPSYSDKVERAIERLDLTDKVICAPYISDEDLPGVYATAHALIYPSLHEGFGLPLLEAMATGIPIACANATALPETAGDAALLFNPGTIDDIACAIIRISEDVALRSQLVHSGTARVATFSWERSVEKLRALYRIVTTS